MYTAYITHPDCLNHNMGACHPESPQQPVTIEHMHRDAPESGLTYLDPDTA